MKRKIVVFFIESFEGGGAERVLLSILRNIDRKRILPKVLVLTDFGKQRDEFHKLEIPIKSIITSNSILQRIKYKLLYKVLPSWLAAKWIISGVEGDTYVAFVEGYCTRIFSKISKRRKVAWVHIDLKAFPWTLNKGIYSSLKEECSSYKNFDQVIGVSESVSEIMRDYYGLTNVTTIYNPIDEKRIKRLSEEETDCEVSKDTFNLVSIGRLTPQKGYIQLISLMPELLHANPEIRLFIIGEGEERDHLENKIFELNLQDKITLLGYKDNPYSILKKMDLFVCSSVAEGFSLVCAEAILCDLPVISMNCAGPNELLGNGKYGMLCDNYEDLKNEIIKLSLNPSMFRDQKLKIQDRKKIFNSSNIISQIMDMI
ncbi:MAG: glycosyltransferase [Muribaculaceae bacterium]|nr:glycosyltransferase [Muribaculaceae bacterium]